MDHASVGKAVDLLIGLVAKHFSDAVRGVLSGTVGTVRQVRPARMSTSNGAKKASSPKPTKLVKAKPVKAKPIKKVPKRVVRTVKPAGANGTAETVVRRGGLPPSPPLSTITDHVLSPHQSNMVSVLRDCRDSFVSGEELASRAGVAVSSISGLVKKLRHAGYQIEGRRGGNHPGYRLIENA